MKFKTYIMEKSEMITKALEFATKHHKGQKDRLGKPYINHPISVMKKLKTETEKTVALLHDVIEDTPVTYNNIKEIFGKEIADIVDVLTHKKNEDYLSYIKRIKSNKTARIVKLADIKDNMDEKRMSKLPIDVQKKLKQKYLKALEILGG